MKTISKPLIKNLGIYIFFYQQQKESRYMVHDSESVL